MSCTAQIRVQATVMPKSKLDSLLPYVSLGDIYTQKKEPSMKQYLGIDIGASSFKYGIGNSKHGLQHFASIRITEKSLEEFHRIIAQILAETTAWDIAGIGIGSPGTIRSSDGKLVGNNPNLPGFIDLSPRALIPESLNFPVFVDNDGNLMALGETTMLEPSDSSVCMGITIGSGIGCGIVQNGEIFHGAHGFAAEAGHCIIVPDGELCSCGQKGCFEAYSSVDGIRRRLYRQDSPHYDLFLPDLIARRREVAEIDQVISEGEDILIRALANLITVLDPQAVILGGGAMDLGLYNIHRVQNQVSQYLPQAHRTKVNCVLARYGNKAGVMGAICMCERKA